MNGGTAAALADLLGAEVASARAVRGGYTPAHRWVIGLRDGRAAFVKQAANDLTAEWLRDEHRFYSAVSAPYLPELLGWIDGERPTLVLEDLSDADWPPPWTDGRVESVLETVRSVAATPVPPVLPRASASGFLDGGWDEVEADPRPLLSTGVVDADWLRRHLPALLEAAKACEIDGDELLHLDLRSDNICFRADRSVVLVDWPLAVAGNSRVDIAFWLPTLVAEGGPAPEDVLPDAGPEAAFVAGFFASRVGHAVFPDSPGIAPLQLEQLRHALPWACRELGLPLPSSV